MKLLLQQSIRNLSVKKLPIRAFSNQTRSITGLRKMTDTTTAGAAATAEVSVQDNPLLTESPFPAFDKIRAEHVVPGVRALLRDLNAEIDDLEKSVVPTWKGLVEPLERISDRLSRAWGAVSHLKSVKDSKELREAVETVQPERVALSLRLSQSKPIYEAFRALKEDAKAWGALTEAQQRIVEGELRDFVLGGVGLEGDQKERFNAIQQELSQLATKFSNNLLDATKAYTKVLTTQEEVEGLPASALALAAQTARGKGHPEATPEKGPWVFTLDIPSYMPVMSHAKNRPLREEMYKAYLSRASSDAMDNTPIIEKILSLRKEKAALLGFSNYADMSMSKKMADLTRAEALLEELRSKSYDAAAKDLEDVRAYAKEQGFTETLCHWDVSYYAERLREAKYNITDEELRPYFALPNVLKGLFSLAKRLFDIEIEAADGYAPTWDDSVMLFRVLKDGRPKAYFFLDAYVRASEKRGGAWMAEVCGQSRLFAPDGERVRLPIAQLVCNQSPPIDGKPSLMTFREVTTLFHEFGHGLQHMLTTVEEGMVSGIRGIEWDAVELPSQYLENWCYDRKTLYTFARHYETGEPLPEDMYQRLVASKNFRSGSMTLRQVHFGLTDLELHARFVPGQGESIYDRERKIAQKTMLMQPWEGDRFLNGFSHIFAGGYSAGYYSYKFSEVLSADAFAAFEEVGLENEDKIKETGRRFRDTVLAMGGGRDPALVFKDFRGRDPIVEPLLRHSGLLAGAQ